MRKAFLLLLAAVLLLLSVCPGGLAQAGDPVTLSLYINDAGATIDCWGSDNISKKIIADTGITLDISKPSANDNQQLQMMLAANDLPDIVVLSDCHAPINYQMEDPNISADIGALIDTYAPELREYLTDQWFEITKSQDGINYTFSNCIYTDQIFKDGRYAIVGPWNPVPLVQDKLYAELGSPDISTPQGLMDTLLKVKEQYPDIMPLFFNSEISKYKFDGVPWNIGLFFGMFGVDKYYFSDDTYYANYRQPQFLDTLLYLNEMYRNGIITDQVFALTPEENNAIREQGKFFYWTAGVGDGSTIPAGNPDVSYQYAPYFDTAEIFHMSSSGWMTVYINANIPEERKEAATRFCAYMIGMDGNIATQWGIEGVDWEYDESARPVRTEEYNRHRTTDWTEYQRISGLGFYNWGINYWDHMLVANTVEKDGMQRKAWEMYKDYSGATSYFYRFDPMSSSEEGVIYQRVTDLFTQYFPKMVMAGSPEETKQAYEEFVAKADDVGVQKVEAHWNNRWAETKGIFGK